jgi:MSHA biogenesis protein MshP
VKVPNSFRLRKQHGFTLVMAIFILVVLALLGAYMSRLTGVQRAVASDALQGARAYLAAKAGLGWATSKLSGVGTCADVNAQTAMSIPDNAGFTVALSCTSSTFQEGANTVNVYRINTKSQYGTYGDADYIYRELETSMVK